jgi:hypothetical protein
LRDFTKAGGGERSHRFWRVAGNNRTDFAAICPPSFTATTPALRQGSLHYYTDIHPKKFSGGNIFSGRDYREMPENRQDQENTSQALFMGG